MLNSHDAWDRLAPPPRRITPMLVAQVLFGGARSQVGWFLFGLGSFFFLICIWHTDLSGWRFGLDKVAHTSGEGTGCQDSGYALGWSNGELSPRIYQNHYRYTLAGKTFEGGSYETNVCVRAGAVDVEYLTSQPEVSRISGMRREPLPAWLALWLAIFPVTGLAMILSGLIQGRLRLRLLRLGLPVRGRLIRKDSYSSDELVKHVMTFEYLARDGFVRRRTVNTQFPERLEDHPAEALLYDPECPETAVLVDELPGKVILDKTGQPAGASFEFVFLPVIAVLIYFWLYRLAN